MKRCVIIFMCLPMLLSACGAKTTHKEHAATIVVPTFSADSAYGFVQAQVDFGPRVPETKAHAACVDYLVQQFQKFGAEVSVQQGQMALYSGEKKQLKNIIARYNANANRRVLLCSHWDSRPFSDQDANSANREKPILGANDGASGVGVLLEVARQLQQHPSNVGVDIVLFDLEDWGAPQWYRGAQREDSWCLGSQYWAAEAKKSGYRADFGVLLDMVGAPGARFYREQFSAHFANAIVDKVWYASQAAGFASYFVDARGGAITDDHYYMNTLAGIPCIDVIQYDPYSGTGFAEYWHTQADDMRHIDRNTLYVVGQTLLQVIYNE